MRNALLAIMLSLGVLAAACGTPASDGDTFSPLPNNVHGTVLMGPMCPVEQVGSPCPDRPIQARVRITFPDGMRTVLDTDARGRFDVTLGPGSYTIEATGLDAGRSSKPTTFEVPAGEGVTNVTVTVDSGIR